MGGNPEAIAELERSQEKEDEEHRILVRDRAIEFTTQVYDRASAYDNAIIIAGYAAFFALWSGVSDDVTRACRLLTAALMGGSLMLYISWQISNMLVRQKFDWERSKMFEYANDAARFNEAWANLEARKGVAAQRLMRFWPSILLPSIVLGFAGGAMLAYNALAIPLGWPQLTG